MTDIDDRVFHTRAIVNTPMEVLVSKDNKFLILGLKFAKDSFFRRVIGAIKLCFWNKNDYFPILKIDKNAATQLAKMFLHLQ